MALDPSPAGALFPSTIWTTIRQAKLGSPGAVEAVLARYRPPIVGFILRQGMPLADAEDLTQEVFLKIVQNHLLERAEKEKGKFRTYLLAITRSVIVDGARRRLAIKRGGEAVTLSLEAPAGAGPPPPADPSPTGNDPAFDREWVMNIVRLASEELRGACARKATRYAEALDAFTRLGAYEPVAAELGATLKDVKNWVYRGRSWLKELVRAQIAAYSSSHEELEAEVRYLSQFLDA